MNKDDAQTIRPATHLELPDSVEPLDLPLKQARHLPVEQPLEVLEEPVEPAESVKAVDKKKPRRFPLWGAVGVSVVSLAVVELGLFIWQLWHSQDWLASAWLVLLVAIAVLAVSAVLREWRGLRQLKKQRNIQQQTRRMLDNPGVGQAKIFCMQLAKKLPVAPSVVTAWQQQLADHHSDQEVVSLFDQLVLSEVDKKAMALLTNQASACGAMIAISPFALLDMLIVLWRNLHLLAQISACYGLTLSYWGRITLVRQVFRHMLYAGASELMTDAGNYALGSSVTGKVSGKLAQGFGAAVLTSRIGLKAMQLSRPMPWLPGKRPGLSDVSSQVLNQLSNKLK